MFLMLFLLLLEPHILLNHLAVEPYRINAIAFAPKMITPVRLLAQTGKRREHANGGTSFQDAHQLRYRQLRRYLHQQMHMIRLNVRTAR